MDRESVARVDMWVFYAVLAGFGDASRDAIAKYSASKSPRVLVSWSYSIFAVLFFLGGLGDLSNPPPNLDPYPIVLLLGILGVGHLIGGLMLTKALSASDLSLCIPMTAFTPVFLLVIAPLVTGEVPHLLGVIGSLLVVLGTYTLNLQPKAGLGAPFRAIRRDEGVQLMLLLAFLWSVTGSVEKVGIKLVGIRIWAPLELLTIALFFIPLLWQQRTAIRAVPGRGWISLFCVGAANALSFGGYLAALKIAPVYYVVCVKRSAIFFSLVLGHLFYNERTFGNRAIGAALMFAGVVVLSLWG